MMRAPIFLLAITILSSVAHAQKGYFASTGYRLGQFTGVTGGGDQNFTRSYRSGMSVCLGTILSGKKIGREHAFVIGFIHHKQGASKGSSFGRWSERIDYVSSEIQAEYLKRIAKPKDTDGIFAIQYGVFTRYVIAYSANGTATHEVIVPIPEENGEGLVKNLTTSSVD